MNCNYKVKITDIQTKYKFKVFCTGYDDSELKQKIDTMYEAWPKATAEGETPTLDNTANATMSIDLKGNTSQETTTGANILPQDKYISTRTLNGITYTNNGDGTFNLAGTATENTTIQIVPIGDLELEANQPYYLYSSVPYNINTFNISVVLGDNGATKYIIANGTYTPTSTPTNERLQFYIANGQSVNATNVKLMLVKGSTAPSQYEPYTNGASPNPDYPQDVHVVTGDNTINICGKNLFDDSIVTNQWSNYSTQEIINVNGANLHKYECKQGDTYTLSATFDSASGNGAILIQFFDKEGNSLGRHAVSNNTTLTQTRTAPANTSYAYIGRYLTIPTTIQLEKNTQATTYEAYTGASYPVNLETMELCKIGNYQDYFYKDSDKWYLHKEIGKIVLNGSEAWTKSSNTNVNRYYIPGTFINTILNVNTIDLISDYFTCITPTQSDAYNVGLSKLNNTSIMANFSLSDTSFDTLQKFTTWLSTHNVVVYYVLATPTSTEITDTTLISQLDALESAMSYKGQTNISQINNDAPFIIDATALKDLSNL